MTYRSYARGVQVYLPPMFTLVGGGLRLKPSQCTHHVLIRIRVWRAALSQ